MSENTNNTVPEETEIEITDDIDAAVDNAEGEVPSDAETIKNYKIMIDTIKELDEQCKFIEKYATDYVTKNYKVKPNILSDILVYDIDEIENKDVQELRNFIKKYAMEELTDEMIYNMPDNAVVDAMKEIKKASLMILSIKKEAEDVKKSSSDVFSDYINYLSSEDVKNARKHRLEVLKEQAEKETDEIEKKKINNLISIMEQSLNFSFLFKRFDMYGDKEIDSIADGFFSPKRGSYHIEKYLGKIKKFGYNPDIYKSFFNIEENFLDEKYHVFNNLFLYIYLKMVAYSDPYSKKDGMFVRSLTAAMANLIYHKFENTESENEFKLVIMSVLDKFMGKYDEFKENNKTYKENPTRLKAEEDWNKHREKVLKEKLDMYGIKYTDETPLKELQEMYTKHVESLQEEQIEKYNASKIKVEDNDDGSVDITPTLKKIDEPEEEMDSPSDITPLKSVNEV